MKQNVAYGSQDAALWVEASDNVRVIRADEHMGFQRVSEQMWVETPLVLPFLDDREIAEPDTERSVIRKIYEPLKQLIWLKEAARRKRGHSPKRR